MSYHYIQTILIYSSSVYKIFKRGLHICFRLAHTLKFWDEILVLLKSETEILFFKVPCIKRKKGAQLIHYKTSVCRPPLSKKIWAHV